MSRIRGLCFCRRHIRTPKSKVTEVRTIFHASSILQATASVTANDPKKDSNIFLFRGWCLGGNLLFGRLAAAFGLSASNRAGPAGASYSYHHHHFMRSGTSKKRFILLPYASNANKARMHFCLANRQIAAARSTSKIKNSLVTFTCVVSVLFKWRKYVFFEKQLYVYA